MSTLLNRYSASSRAYFGAGTVSRSLRVSLSHWHQTAPWSLAPTIVAHIVRLQVVLRGRRVERRRCCQQAQRGLVVTRHVGVKDVRAALRARAWFAAAFGPLRQRWCMSAANEWHTSASRDGSGTTSRVGESRPSSPSLSKSACCARVRPSRRGFPRHLNANDRVRAGDDVSPAVHNVALFVEGMQRIQRHRQGPRDRERGTLPAPRRPGQAVVHALRVTLASRARGASRASRSIGSAACSENARLKHASSSVASGAGLPCVSGEASMEHRDRVQHEPTEETTRDAADEGTRRWCTLARPAGPMEWWTRTPCPAMPAAVRRAGVTDARPPSASAVRPAPASLSSTSAVSAEPNVKNAPPPASSRAFSSVSTPSASGSVRAPHAKLAHHDGRGAH